jgi:hypothetical protein
VDDGAGVDLPQVFISSMNHCAPNSTTEVSVTISLQSSHHPFISPQFARSRADTRPTKTEGMVTISRAKEDTVHYERSNPTDSTLDDNTPISTSPSIRHRFSLCAALDGCAFCVSLHLPALHEPAWVPVHDGRSSKCCQLCHNGHVDWSHDRLYPAHLVSFLGVDGNTTPKNPGSHGQHGVVYLFRCCFHFPWPGVPFHEHECYRTRYLSFLCGADYLWHLEQLDLPSCTRNACTGRAALRVRDLTNSNDLICHFQIFVLMDIIISFCSWLPGHFLRN